MGKKKTARMSGYDSSIYDFIKELSKKHTNKKVRVFYIRLGKNYCFSHPQLPFCVRSISIGTSEPSAFVPVTFTIFTVALAPLF